MGRVASAVCLTLGSIVSIGFGVSLKRMYVKISFFFFSLSLVCLYCPFIVLYFFHVANFLQVFWYQSFWPHLPNTQSLAVICNDDDVANMLPACASKKVKWNAKKLTIDVDKSLMLSICDSYNNCYNSRVYLRLIYRVDVDVCLMLGISEGYSCHISRVDLRMI